MHRFAETAEAIGGTSSKLKKIAFLADYLRTLSEDNLRAAAVFFTGRPFALTDARTLVKSTLPDVLDKVKIVGETDPIPADCPVPVG